MRSCTYNVDLNYNDLRGQAKLIRTPMSRFKDNFDKYIEKILENSKYI